MNVEDKEARWEVAVTELVESLRAAERNPNEGRPPVREVVALIMERCAKEGLD